MQQSNVIFANLVIAYLLFITLRGELPSYITLLRGGGTKSQGGNPISGSNPITEGAAALLDNSSSDINTLLDQYTKNTQSINNIQSEITGLSGLLK